tara:strand:+ start:528 stop:1796 length:1269 start_codon:yes stop_codon:yes gene_type:complete
MDEAGYADIVSQIKGAEFETELHDRLEQAEEKHKIEVELAKKEILGDKEKEIAKLQSQVDNHNREIEFAKKDALADIQEDIVAKDKQIERLKNEKKAAEVNAELAVTKATNTLEKDILDLQNKLNSADTERELEKQQMEQTHLIKVNAKDEIIRLKDDEIERVKDMKLKQSVKEIGEKLEQWCENQFNILRQSAFPNAYFEKDNTSVKDVDEERGTKGDYIFRDSDSDGIQFISIMFEMKDKMEGTKGETNESHLAKLDKDRKKKDCEYAVLVSMLEPENELYNSGIVDMSHKYDKMYVVRPHNFIPILTLIRNEARKSLEIRQELEIMTKQNVDVENFQNTLLDFQDGFGKNVDTARKYYETAIKDIDGAIAKLEKIKRSLTTSGNQLRLANNKTQDLSIKKLTRGNPTMKAKFDELKKID